jgi:hypothetical protein
MKAHVLERANNPVSMVAPVTTFRAIPIEEYVVDSVVKEHSFTQAIPVTMTRTRPALVNREVAEWVTESYLETVPHEVEKEVSVRVCKMVPGQKSCCGQCCGGR